MAERRSARRTLEGGSSNPLCNHRQRTVLERVQAVLAGQSTQGEQGDTQGDNFARHPSSRRLTHTRQATATMANHWHHARQHNGVGGDIHAAMQHWMNKRQGEWTPTENEWTQITDLLCSQQPHPHQPVQHHRHRRPLHRDHHHHLLSQSLYRHR